VPARKDIATMQAQMIEPMDRTTEAVIRSVDGEEARALVPALVAVLIDCVQHGASVSFMSPLSLARAEAFWTEVAESVGRRERVLLVAIADEQVVGTVQVVHAGPENQPHRADVAKMLVHSTARKRGIGAALMTAAETAARSLGKTLLVLDTVTGGDAERLYARLGWQVVGSVPDYALFPDGRPCATTIFYKAVGDA
jgi:GNAT superfamily N-acetyltransferase